METITEFSTPLQTNNAIYVNPDKASMISSKIRFKGTGNILFVEEGVTLRSTTLLFNGNNGICYLSASHHPYILNADISNNCCIFVGSNCYINNTLALSTSEQQNIIIGDDCLLSFGIFIRTADPHLIYDCATKRRINPSKSVFIGDHVWIGQNTLILKGSRIGSGSIVGGASVVAGKAIPSNSSWAGNPVRCLRENVFFSGECVHAWTTETTEQHQVMQSTRWIYEPTSGTLDQIQLDKHLKSCQSADERLCVLKTEVINCPDKNRFFISSGPA